MRRLLSRILSDDPLIRAMSYQSVLSAFGEGAFLAGSAVYFTQIVGLSAAQVGLGMTIAGIATFFASVPLGRAADAFGTRRTWIVGSLLEALLFACWLAARDFAAYVVVTTALELAETWMRAGRNAYRFAVFPRETRIRSMAYMRAARNVGYTLGAAAGGLALAAHSDRLIEAVPIVTAVVLLANTAWVTRLPRVRERADHGGESAIEELVGGGALRNRGFLVACVLDGVLATHQVLLNVVIPLWLVEETDAPRVLLAWLFGTNTVLAVLLQVAAARGVSDVRTSVRAERRGALCFVLSCVIVLVTHDTTGWLTIGLVWLGHVTVTGAELFQSAGQWGIQAELSDPRQRGEYQGVANLGNTVGTVWAPAAYTYLAMTWGASGWLVIAAIIGVAAVLIAPAARAAERYLDQAPATVTT
ncbi:MFS transporter [Nocardioides sp. BP30]|uniref:MFS transporter n=1 Tax=Nocardioides sp. BP30 TaxID=3036374 RepID=UPI002469A068|nr:MFS transporter [Nocardioides sp. BP30]WGL52932.1 MFS transporter [Nocardioides sp. BP30]